MSDNPRTDEVKIKRGELCSWCGETDALVPMHQGGSIHTICDSCGTGGRLVDTNDFALSYIHLLRLARKLEQENVELKDRVKHLEKYDQTPTINTCGNCGNFIAHTHGPEGSSWGLCKVRKNLHPNSNWVGCTLWVMR